MRHVANFYTQLLYFSVLCCGFVYEINDPSPLIDCIRSMKFVWRFTGNIIRTVRCGVLRNDTLTLSEQFLQLTVAVGVVLGFFL